MKSLFVAIALVSGAASLFGQGSRPPTVISPEVAADRRITFRLLAPKANAVTVSGEWDGKAVPMEKGADGVWSATVGPIAPDLYSYSFNVDGVAMTDPRNRDTKPMRSPTSSAVLVRGEKPLLIERRGGIPHGTVHLHEYDSKSLRALRRLRVYTPAAYEANASSRFPVLYLLHGSGDNEATWTEFGRAHVILDNLIAEGKAQPMIVVMTDGHAVTEYSPETRGQNVSAFEKDFLEDVVPLIDRTYRTAADRDHRAIAGLSMGGNQSLIIGLNHREQFAWVGAMSSAIREPQQPLATFWVDPNSTKLPLRLFWIAIGKEDFLIEENRRFHALLTERKVAHEYHETEGAHKWIVWRRYLADLAPRLFVGS